MNYCDDVPGTILDPKLVEDACREDISEAEAMKVWKTGSR